MSSSRDELIRKVETGELSPDQAEDIARDAGLPSLASTPPTGTFDPRLIERWTLAMAVAWIADRSFDSVERLSDKYREHQLVWVRHGKGHVLRTREPAVAEIMRGTRAKGEIPDPRRWENKPGFRGAISQLWQALLSGDLAATARNVARKGRSEIAPIKWRMLRWRFESEIELVSPIGAASSDEAAYRDVRVNAADVQRLWPPQERMPAGLPDVVRPDQPGYMTVFHAALWIATKGGTLSFDPLDDDAWAPAFKELTDRIAEGEVEVVGFRGDQREFIPREQFVGIRVSYPSGKIGLWLEEEPHLCSYIFIGQEEWESGQHDSIQDRKGPVWVKLLVAKRDVFRLWPFHIEPPHMTGVPGRPSSIHMVRPEFDRRAEAGETAPTLTEEVRELRAWFVVNYPTLPPPTEKTITNNLRKAFRNVNDARN